MLTLSNPQHLESGEIRQVTATVQVEDATATSRIQAHYAHGFDDLCAFLADLAKHWKGWEGQKSWTSLEADLTIVARFEGFGRVVLSVELRGPDAPFAWTFSAAITTDPGAQMTQAAHDARHLFARLT
jgi:Family of unknown function (DUF6228)